MKVLFTVLSGSYERMVYGLADDLWRRSLSEEEMQPVMLWFTEAFRSQPVSYPEEYVHLLLKRHPIPRFMEDAYYRALRYKSIDLMDVIRINMIDTPNVKVERLLRWSIRYLYMCERLLEDCEIRAVVLLLGRGLFQRCLGMMARSMAINTFYLCDGFIPGKTLHIWNTEEELTDDMKGISLPPLTSAQKEELKQFKDEQKKIKNVATSPYDATVFYHKIQSFFKLLFQWSPVGNRSIWFFVKQDILRRIRRFFACQYYTEDLPEKYVFLPLIVHHDFQYPLFWAEYTNIEYLVNMCLRHLPDGYALVIKEHPHFSGGVPLKTLRRLMWDIRLVIAPVSMDPHQVLDGCCCAVTFCSSVGWQAMVHDKPVITIQSRSHPWYQYFYASYGVTIDVDEDQLCDGYHQAIQMQPNQEKIDSFLYHVVFDRIHASDKVCPVEYIRMTEDDNIHVVCEYLYRKIKEVMKK